MFGYDAGARGAFGGQGGTNMYDPNAMSVFTPQQGSTNRGNQQQSNQGLWGGSGYSGRGYGQTTPGQQTGQQQQPFAPVDLSAVANFYNTLGSSVPNVAQSDAQAGQYYQNNPSGQNALVGMSPLDMWQAQQQAQGYSASGAMSSDNPAYQQWKQQTWDPQYGGAYNQMQANMMQQQQQQGAYQHPGAMQNAPSYGFNPVAAASGYLPANMMYGTSNGQQQQTAQQSQQQQQATSNASSQYSTATPAQQTVASPYGAWAGQPTYPGIDFQSGSFLQ